MNIFNISSGVSVGEFAPDVDETYGLFKNGLFKKTKNQIGTFTHKVSEVPETMGIEAVCEVSFERDETIPKIPYQVFQSILKFYKDVYKDIKSEVYTLVVWDKEAKDFLLEKGTNLKFGARPLRRAIQRYVEDEISEMILKGDVHDGQTINVDIKNNELKFNVE